MTVNTLGSQDAQRSSRTVAEWLLPLLPIAVAIFCLSSLLYYHLCHEQLTVRAPLQLAIAGTYRTLGFAPAFMFFLLVLTWASIWFVTGRIERPIGRLLRLCAMAVMLGVLMNLGDGGVTPAFHKGELGAWFADRLVAAFGYYPSIVVVWIVTFGSLLLATDFFFSEGFERLRAVAPDAGEAGVEAAVTDHLKGLQAAGSVGALEPQPALRPSPEAPAAAAAPPRAEPAWSDLAAAVDAAAPAAASARTALPEADAEWRRQSYFERRRTAEPADGGADAEGARVLLRPRGRLAPLAPPSEHDDAAPPSVEGLAVAPPAPEAEVPASAETAAPAEAAAPVPVQASVGPPAPSAAAADDVREVELPPGDDPGDDLIVTDEDLSSEIEQAERPQHADLGEPVVSIPRPEPAPAAAAAPEPESAPREAARQQKLFEQAVDEDLLREAIELVTSSGRATAAFLQRKLRVDYEQACDVLRALADRGIVELDADPTHGRVVT